MRKKIGVITCIVVLLACLYAVNQSSALVTSKTYTYDADFDEGTLVGVEHETVHDQLQLSEEVTTYPIMWIANAGEDTVSKWDTDLNKELARYHTWFGPPAHHDAWTGPSPSRTAVDLDGNCYVANRHFDNLPADVIKIFSSDWIDRNNNLVLDTSYDANDDGSIDPSEMLPMTDTNSNNKIDDDEIQDERIAWAVSVGPNNGLGRSLAIDINGNIWLGLYNTRTYYKLSNVDGSILAGPIDVSPNTPYGALVDRDGILWGASLGTNLLKLDTNTNTKLNVYDHGAYGYDYGIALGYDASDNTHVYQAEYSGNTYIEFDSSSETFSTPAAEKFAALGVAVDSNGDIFASRYMDPNVGDLVKFQPDGSKIWSAAAQVSSEARGTIVDSNDDVWVIHRDANKMAKFRGSDGASLGVFDTGHQPYTYTDATGLSLRSSVIAFGTWTVVFDSEAEDTPWGTISWSSDEPEGTSITVKARSSNDQSSWSPWEIAANGVSLSATPDGRYLEIDVALQILEGEVSPILYDLTVEIGIIPVYADIKPGSWPNPINKRSYGVFSVAICGTYDFDSMQIDPTSVRIFLEDMDGGVSPLRWSYGDVATPYIGNTGGGHDLGGDGYIDLVLHFETRQVVETLGLCEFARGETVTLLLAGNLYEQFGGTPIQGQDYVLIIEARGGGGKAKVT